MLAVGAPSCHAVALILTHLGSVAQQHATRKVPHRLPTAHHIIGILSSATLVRSEIVRDGCDNGGVIETQGDPRQAIGYADRNRDRSAGQSGDIRPISLRATPALGEFNSQEKCGELLATRQPRQQCGVDRRTRAAPRDVTPFPRAAHREDLDHQISKGWAHFTRLSWDPAGCREVGGVSTGGRPGSGRTNIGTGNREMPLHALG